LKLDSELKNIMKCLALHQDLENKAFKRDNNGCFPGYNIGRYYNIIPGLEKLFKNIIGIIHDLH
jgi:hypothetical protein